MTMKRLHQLLAGVVACGLALFGASCSSPPKTSTTRSPASPTAAAARAYIAAANPANSVITTFGNQATHWKTQTTDSQAESEAQPVVTALQNMQEKLLGTIWPTSARKDVDTLVPAVGLMIRDLQALASLNFVNVSSWESTFSRDLSTIYTDTTAVREDLGLPATFRNGQSF
ncbi:MAG TPA: hypothetical protein VN816_08245 [Acidimicrobiales bacterium]|nr:hypothetical protein [Acidimicrobiales bacterium]